MTHLLESQHLLAPLTDDAEQGPHAQSLPVDAWLPESAPEDFLREVVDTLAGFLRDDPVKYAPKTGDAPPGS